MKKIRASAFIELPEHPDSTKPDPCWVCGGQIPPPGSAWVDTIIGEDGRWHTTQGGRHRDCTIPEGYVVL